MTTEAFILVGGRSSRLGRDKAFERIGGQTLAERALRAVERSGIASRIFFVTGNDVEFAIEAARLDTPFVFDLIEGRGPLGGLHTALTHADAEWIFVLACDLPFVKADLISYLSRYTAGEYGSLEAVVPEQPDGRIQPLCGFYNVVAARPIVDEMIGRQRPSPPMHEIVGRLDHRIVKPAEYESIAAPPAAYFNNVNTEEDLKIARRLVRED